MVRHVDAGQDAAPTPARRTYAGLRLAAALACIAALIHRLFWGLSSQTIAGDNFFAYLTVQSNCALAAVLLIGAAIAVRRADDPRWFSIALSLVLTWTLTAGLAFGLIVWQAGIRGIRVDVPWSDHLLHFWLPTCTAIAWVLTPGHRSVPWRIVPLSLIFPVLWGLVTLWRGPLVGWYPYYFLDPRQVSGPLEFVITSAIALSIFAAIAAILVVVSRLNTPTPRFLRPPHHRPADAVATTPPARRTPRASAPRQSTRRRR